MPHRPEGQRSASISQGCIVNSSIYTPPRVAGSTAAAIMRQHTTDSTSTVAQKPQTATIQFGEHISGVVTPVVKSKGCLAWLSTSIKSSDSTDRSMATTATIDDSRSIATLATEDEREATASALLMVAKVAEREQQQQHYLKGILVEGSYNGERTPDGVLPVVSSSASTCSVSTVPLKKRKKQLDILRRDQVNTEVRKNVCHISPVSHDSGNPSSAGSRTQSYDSKDLRSASLSSPKLKTTQTLLDSSKVHSTAQIGEGAPSLPVPQVVIPHFPTVLHQVLADKDLTTSDNGPIINWLEDGEAWKVENWNAMRRHVLPKYFSDLRDEHGISCGTIDAFLHNIDAWGFEEIKNGPYAGAYRHKLFIRGAQKLSVKMQFTSDLSSGDDNNTTKKLPEIISSGRSVSGETERMMLQVPMLGAVESKILSPNKRPRYESRKVSQVALHLPYTNESSPVMVWGGGSGQYSDASHTRALGIRASVTINGSTPYIDPRTQVLRVPLSDSMTMPRQAFQYNTPQVRSGRGALKGLASTTQQYQSTMTTSQSPTPAFRHGFPVSNRGKGFRKSTACRNTFSNIMEVKMERKLSTITSTPDIPAGTTDKSEPLVKRVNLTEAQRIGSSVKGKVAVAISRKLIGKFPVIGGRKVVENTGASNEASLTSNI